MCKHSALTRLTRPVEALGRRLRGASSELWNDASGAVAIYVMLVSAVLLGAGALAFDIGRLGSVRTQMQNAADAAALAGAMELDSLTDAQARATAVATNAATNRSLFQTVAGTPEIEVQSVSFYSEYDTSTSPATTTAATGDADAWFIEVVIVPRDVNLLMEPALAVTTGGTAKTTQLVTARAVATLDIIICNSPPLMICDPIEDTPPVDLSNPSNAGRQMVVKLPVGGVPTAPGQFGLLCPESGCGANNISAAIAEPDPSSCLDSEVTTAPGAVAVSVSDAMNTRFGTAKMFNPDYPAPDVINLPRATNISPAGTLFNNNWDRTTYWSDKHGGAPVPAPLSNATRYQAYLYELGLNYEASGGGSGGGITIYPPDGTYVETFPPAADVPVALNPADKDDPNYDGVPAAKDKPVTDPNRRVVTAVMLPCVALGVKGSQDYESHGKVVEMFITEESPPPSDPDFPAGIFGEINRVLTHRTSEDIYASPRLVQ